MKTGDLNVFLKKRIFSESVKRILVKLLFPFRNHFILFDVSTRAKKNRVNLNYWYEKPNLGDELSYHIVTYMLGLRGLSLESPISSIKHLYAIGSIITAGLQDCTIWGSGILRVDLIDRIKGRNLDIRAVRGPLTRMILEDLGYKVPAVYGDPAILLPRLYMPNNIEKKYKYGVISQKDQVYKCVSDLDFMRRDDVLIIDIKTKDYKSFIDKICSTEKVVSSSLHGIIIAETYGIPALLHQPTTESLFKYCDWYYSTGRLEYPVAKKLSDIETINIAKVPNLEELQTRLIETFPYDLFK